MGGAETGTIYVKEGSTGTGTSWSDALGSLVDALIIAEWFDEIWVAQGTYTPGVNRENTFQLEDNFTVLGGFKGDIDNPFERDWRIYPTTLSGDIGVPDDNVDNCYHVVEGADGAVLDGFIITGGNADGSGSNSCGGGMINYYCSPEVKNCVFTNNRARVSGGGMDCSYSSKPEITNCVFSKNESDGSGGGLTATLSGFPTLINCVFNENEALGNGGGLYSTTSSYYADPNLINCTFSRNIAGNNGGGIYIGSGASLSMENCIVWDNTATSGSGDSIYKVPTPTTSLIAHWKLDDGTGPTAKNSVDNDDDGTLQGSAGWTTDTGGILRGALSLEFDGDWVKVFPVSQELDNLCGGGEDPFVVEYAICLWVYCDDIADAPIIQASGGTAPVGWGMEKYNGKFRFWWGDSAVARTIDSDKTFSAYEWVHLAMVRSEEYYFAYVNGVRQGAEPINNGVGALEGGSIWIGGAPAGDYFKGSIDDIRIYGRSKGNFKTIMAATRINNCDIEGCGGSGSGWDESLGLDYGDNIDINPEFADPTRPAGDNDDDDVFMTANDGLRLTVFSPCLDKGYNYGRLSPYQNGEDLKGDPRINSNRTAHKTVDMGAYEYLGVMSVTPSFFNVTLPLGTGSTTQTLTIYNALFPDTQVDYTIRLE